MKALLYKEFKLAMHPICYIFVLAFPLMILIPSYPLGIGFIYVLTCYPILFLGANKGQQSNDLLYSTLLPVRKKDIVKARIATVAILQFAFVAIMSCLLPLAIYLQSTIPNPPSVGITLQGFPLLIGICLVGYALADLIFFPIYYRNGRSIVMSTLFTILGFVVYLSIFTIALPFIPVIEDGFNWMYANLWAQFIVLAVALIIYFVIHIAVYKLSSKELERVDF